MPDKFPTTDVIVNNEPLQILGETGIIGFLAFAGFVIYIVLVAWRQIKHLQDWEENLGQSALVSPYWASSSNTRPSPPSTLPTFG